MVDHFAISSLSRVFLCEKAAHEFLGKVTGMQPESVENQGSQAPAESQVRGIAISTETGYQVMEGKGALVNRNSLIFTVGRTISLIGDGFYDPMNEFELLGVFTAVAGVGAVLGSLLTGVLARKISVKMLAVAGIAGLGLFDIIGSSSTTIIVGMIFYCILAAFDSVFLVAYGALILKVTPNALIGRVSGVISPLVALAGFITTVVVSILATVFNPQVNPRTPFPNFAVFFIDLFIGCGLVILLGSLVGALLLRKTKEEIIVGGSLTDTPGVAVTGISATLE